MTFSEGKRVGLLFLALNDHVGGHSPPIWKFCRLIITPSAQGSGYTARLKKKNKNRKKSFGSFSTPMNIQD